MVAKVTLLARVKNGENYIFKKVEIKRGRPVAPANATTYYLRYSDNGRRKVEAVGAQIDAAYVAFQNKERNMSRQRAGLLPLTNDIAATDTLLADAIEEYLDNAQKAGNDSDTVAIKKRALEDFQQVAATNGVLTIDRLRDAKTGKRIVLAYLDWMRKNIRTVKTGGTRPENTHHARLQKVSAFLKQHGIKLKKDAHAGSGDNGLLDHSEFPKYKGKKATKYSPAIIQAMMAVANIDEADLIQTFLVSGFRDEEVAHLEWSDVNFTDGSINVHTKAKTTTRLWTWKPKDNESRSVDIPLSADFLDRLKARQKRYASSKCALIFPSGVCKPDNNLLRRVRKVAKRAGVTQPITLHKFRRTFGSYIAEAYGVEMARQCLGHSDIATTQSYLSADTEDAKKVRDTIGNVQAKYFEGVKDSA